MINQIHIGVDSNQNNSNNIIISHNTNGVASSVFSINNHSNQFTIRKSKKDTNEYKFIILKNNMRCLLIYDKDADKSAAAMTVNIGSLCDPKEYEGLAHFLEHMLFMGTEKFPDENDFSEFLSKNSGDSNAYTDLDSTQYYFDIKNEKFVEALDRFSNFFKKPLFNKSAVEREMKAVESEHVKNIKSDDDRFLEILRSESHPSTPFAKFQTGSLMTLKKPHIRKNLKKFYKSHYSSNLMALCVMSKIPLEEIEKIVKILFEEVEEIPCMEIHEVRQEFIPESFYPYEKDYNLNYFYRILNIRENSTLSFYWMINENLNIHYKSSPLEYVINLLEHEGKNSLASSLTKDQLISDLEAGYDTLAHTYNQIYITVTLTDKGFENYLEIIKRVMLYIKKIQSFEINKEFFEEYQRMSYVDFDYFEKDEPVNFCSELSNNILLYNPEDVISGAYIVEEYNPILIRKYMNMLDVNNMNVYFCSNKFENEFSCFGTGGNNLHPLMEICGNSFIVDKNSKVIVEKHYGTKFTKEKYDFENFFKINEKYMDDYGFCLPPSNAFIPKKFDLKDYSSSKLMKQINFVQPPYDGNKLENFSTSSNKIDNMNDINGMDLILKDSNDILHNPNLLPHSNFSLISNSPFEILNQNPLNDLGEKHPKLIITKENKYNIWYKHDTTFKIPKAFLYSQIYLTRDVFNYSYDTYESYDENINYHIDYIHYKAYIDLWYDFLHKELRETIYLAAIAKVDFQLYVNNLGLSLELSGFNDSLKSFVKEIVNVLQKYSDMQKIDNFNEKLLTILESNIKSIKNSFKSSASTQVSLKLSSLITTPHSDRNKILFILEKLKSSLTNSKNNRDFLLTHEFKKFEFFIKNYLKKSFFEWLVQGNILPEEGIEIIEIFHNHFKSSELKLIEMNQIRTIKLSPDINFFYTFESEEENNSAIISYFQLGYLSEKEACIIEIIEKFLQEKFFDEMRTKQALGYSVYLRHEYNRKISSICCMVQSNVQSPEYVFEKISDFFIQNGLNDEENFTEDDFKKYVESIKSDLMKKDINLSEEVYRNFEEIMIREYVFNRNEERIKIYDNELSFKDVVDFYEEHFINNVRRLDVELVAKKHKEQNEKFKKKNFDELNGNMDVSGNGRGLSTRIEIKSVDAFKRICEVYPDYYYYIKLK